MMSSYSGAEIAWSTSTPMNITLLPLLFASWTAAIEPRPTGPATAMMMSAPSWMKPSACWRPLAVSLKSPVNEPCFFTGSQPRSLTFVPFCLL